MIDMLPFDKRTPDAQYRTLLYRILRDGKWMPSGMDEERLTIFGHVMEFDLSNGAPLVTERDIVTPNPKTGRSGFSMGTGEIIAFMHGARTHEELKAFGCPWWAPWVTPEKCAKRGLPPGDLGPGSYGPAYRSFPMSDGTSFDQIKAMLQQIKERPELRTHQAIPWVPQYCYRLTGRQQKVVVVPCHGDMMIRIDTKTGRGTYIHTQWSCDAPVGLAFNLFQHGIILPLMLSAETGYSIDKVVYIIKDAHIYRRQIRDVEGFLGATQAERFPTVTADPGVKNFFDFRGEHFKVEDYHPQLPPHKIDTPV